MSSTQAQPVSRAQYWTGIVLTVLAGLFFLMDGVMKLLKPSFVVEMTTQLGYPEETLIPIGIVLIVCTLLYLIPQTAGLGGLLLTGYLGGAVATHVRVGHPIFQILFPVIVAAILWSGLVLRDRRLRALLPWGS